MTLISRRNTVSAIYFRQKPRKISGKKASELKRSSLVFSKYF